MPVTYSIDTARKLIHTTCSPPLVLADVIGHFRTLMEDPACAGHLDVLLDVSEADSLPQSIYFNAISAELAAIRAKVQFEMCAIIATHDAMFGMMRVFEAVTGPYFREVRVFRGAAEAEAWLDTAHPASNTDRLPR